MTQEANKTGKELERWVADAYRQVGARKVEHDVPMAGNQVDVYKEPHPEPAEPLPTLSPDVPATICIPAGPFWIGSLLDDPDAHENEKPRREVNLQAYEIGRYPVTNTQYACFLTGNPDYPVPYLDEEKARPYNWHPEARSYPEGKADHPVVLVSWEDAMAYCRWLSQITERDYRLPTEEKWEKAARGGLPETRRYPWGNEWRSSACNTRELGRNGTTAVYEFERINQSPFRVVDMAGNVWEWTASSYERYPGCPHESSNYGQAYRVVRGGSWRNSCRGARIACRGRSKPQVRRPYLGFRVASGVVDTVSEGATSEQMIDRVKLRERIISCFNEEELRTLCFDLKVDYDDLRGEGRAGKARELVAYFERRRRIRELVAYCRRVRPYFSL